MFVIAGVRFAVECLDPAKPRIVMTNESGAEIQQAYAEPAGANPGFATNFSTSISVNLADAQSVGSATFRLSDPGVSGGLSVTAWLFGTAISDRCLFSGQAIATTNQP